jgi:lipid-binding SYLF domain-containing protein
MIVPEDDLVLRPPNWFESNVPNGLGVLSDEDNFRKPQRICDPCSYQLKDLQPDLRLLVSRANQETVVNYTSQVPSLPSIDFYLENEIKKATSMLFCFKNTLGEEKIPRELLDIAKGVVFLTMLKAGFMFTGRYGTGLVVAKLPDDTWSAPSAVQLSGVGWGLQIGAELTDVMLILSTDSAVNTFKSRAQISVGAELGVSVGPIGRSIESDVTAGNKGAAHAFSYAQSKGLFFGASLEASGIASRQDVNRAFYGEKVSVSALLSGEYPIPKGAEPLYSAISDVLAFKSSSQLNQQRAKTYTNGSSRGGESNISVLNTQSIDEFGLDQQLRGDAKTASKRRSSKDRPRSSGDGL